MKAKERLPDELGNRIIDTFEKSLPLKEWSSKNPLRSKQLREALCEFIEAFELVCSELNGQKRKAGWDVMLIRNFSSIGRNLVDRYTEEYGTVSYDGLRWPVIQFLSNELVLITQAAGG